MQFDQASLQATRDIGAYLLTHYRDGAGALQAVNAVSALGAWAGVFAQVQARALLRSGVIQQTESSLVEVKTTSGETFYFGDAINRCVMEGDVNPPSFWMIAAGAAKDAKINDEINVIEIAKRSARDVGTPTFGRPRVDSRYTLTELPIQAVQRHAPILLQRFLATGLSPGILVLVFGSAAQSFAAFAAGEIADVRADLPMKRADIVRLYMESAIPMSKLDLRTAGVAVEPS
jgi:hypothetical protein